MLEREAARFPLSDEHVMVDERIEHVVRLGPGCDLTLPFERGAGVGD